MKFDHDPKIRELARTAIKTTIQQITNGIGDEKLHGYALCTDDDVCGVYHIYCTKSWVNEKSAGYAEVGYISVEWEDQADDSLFDPVNNLIRAGYDDRKVDFSTERDKRFESLVLALKDCRDAGLLDSQTHISVGSTDPSDHLEFLEMRGIDRLNNKALADELAKALLFEQYRDQYA